MDSFSLKTASTYVNNLLLARGLLQDGKSVEFAKPSKGEGGTEATMAQVINIIHDLILRRDREQEQREALIQTIRSLRTDATRHTFSTEKLQAKNEDLSRQLSLCQSQERAARTALRSAESSARALREEMLRLKATVQQVRTACANDVRKRDVQIQKLKTHLTAQQRGNKTGLVGASITITPGATGLGTANGSLKDDDMPDFSDPEYSLKQETNEFLTQLSQGLSDENDGLISLVRGTLSTLRDLQGIPDIQQSEGGLAADMSRIEDIDSSSSGMVQLFPTSCDALATDMDTVLQSLKSLLTNPNFVPVDEVTMREEEIVRLRAGFEKLEARWREAIALMNSWRERMANGGDTVNLEELKVGLGLGANFGVSVMGNGSTQQRLADVAEEPSELSDLDLDSAAEEDDVLSAPSPKVLEIKKTVQEATGHDEVELPLQSPLREANGNAVPSRRVAFTGGVTGGFKNAKDGQDENSSVPDNKVDGSVATNVGARPTTSRLPRKALKRQHSPERSAEARSPKLTVQQKLGHAQAEADAAIAAADRTAAAGQVQDPSKEVGGTHGAQPTSTRKSKVSGRPKRRKSTLSRDEMADLLAGLIN